MLIPVPCKGAIVVDLVFECPLYREEDLLKLAIHYRHQPITNYQYLITNNYFLASQIHFSISHMDKIHPCYPITQVDFSTI